MMDKAERNAVWHESVERFGTRLQSVVCMGGVRRTYPGGQQAPARQT